MSNPVAELTKAPGAAVKYTRAHLITALFVGLIVVVLYKLANTATQGRLGLALARIPVLGRLFMALPLPLIGTGIALAAAAWRAGVGGGA